MPAIRNVLLWCSENEWLKNHIPRYRFIKKAVKKFMPGESASDALEAARKLKGNNIPAVFTRLGENITSLLEAYNTTGHYLKLLEDIGNAELDGEVSVKLTQIGFDLSAEETYKNLARIALKSAGMNKLVWIDMEGSGYTGATIDFYERIKKEHPNTGICIQAYLYRSAEDLERLMKIDANIRLVKGAYKESEGVVYKSKQKIDENYFNLAKVLLNRIKQNGIRGAFATHDLELVNRITGEAERMGIDRNRLEFQMLYGIRTNDQKMLAARGNRMRVLISYGESWYPWYVRRLAERPANMLFVVKNIFK